MNLQDLLAALSGNSEAAGYLSNPNSNPIVNRTQRYPSGIPMPNTTGPDGMRLPLPRIQGGGPRMQAQKPEAYPLVYGPSVADANQPRPQQPFALPPRAPVMRFRDAARPVGPAMMDRPVEMVMAPWTQPQQIEAGPSVSENRLPIGSPAINRGLEPLTSEAPGLLARGGRLLPGTEAPGGFDADAEWRAANARVRATMGRDPTGLREAARRERQGWPGRTS